MSEIRNGVEIGDQPFDRITKLCEVMTDALTIALETEAMANNEEIDPVRVIVLLEDTAGRAGAEMFGFESAADGIASILAHLKSVLASQGKSMGVMTQDGVMIMPES